MTKWEYTNAVFEQDDFLDFLAEGIHEYGKQGWEMCGISNYIDIDEVYPEVRIKVYVIIFKRKIED